MWFKQLFFVFKLLVSVGLIALVVGKIDTDAVLARIASINLVWIPVVTGLMLVILGLLVLRWNRILRVVDMPLSTAKTAQIVLVGQFFNQTLPSNIGGDAMRVYYTWRLGHDPARAFASVLLDRIAGLFALLVLVTATLPILWANPPSELLLVTIHTLVVVGWASMAVLFALDNGLSRRFDQFRLMRFFIDLSRDARALACSPVILAYVVATSVLVHLLTVMLAWSLDRALGGDVAFSAYLVAMLATLLILSLPISVAGWGVREQSLVLILASFAIGEVQAFSVSILFGLVMLMSGIPGGIIWLTTGMKRAQPPNPLA